MKFLHLDTLQSRCDKLCLNFAKKAEKHPKFQKWFKETNYKQNTRQDKYKYCDVKAKHNRLDKSPLSFLTKKLNEYYNKKWTYCIFLQGELLQQRRRLPQLTILVLFLMSLFPVTYHLENKHIIILYYIINGSWIY